MYEYQLAELNERQSRSSFSRRPKWLRAAAIGMVAAFSWTFMLATPAMAIANAPKLKREGVRVLTLAEMH